jgi:orotate phosphoribosyltransferase
MATTPDLQQLRDLMQRHCFQYGDFTLRSGRKSKYYYNGKRVTLRPSAARLIGEALVDVVLASGAEAVGGPELGAVPIAMATGLASLSRGRDLPVFVVREQEKAHGPSGGRIAEPYPDDGDALLIPGRRVAIVEDAITTGGAVQMALDAVEALDCRVVLIAVLVERHEGGGDALRAKGYDVLALFRTDEEGRLSITEAFIDRLAAATAAR